MSSPAIQSLILLLIMSAAVFVTGDEKPTVYEVLQEYDFPVGLLPVGVTEYELDRSTGNFEVYLNEECKFSVEDYDLRYQTTITGTISVDKIENIKGISVQILFIWFNIGTVTRSGDNLNFKVGIASADFTLDNFYERPQCGCGFECVDGEREDDKVGFNNLNPFVSALLE